MLFNEVLHECKTGSKKAKDHIEDVFGAEHLENVGLEEVVLNEEKSTWEITVGFSRPWDYPKVGLVTGLQPQHPKRRYKIVRINNETGEVKSIKIHEIENA